METDPKRMEFWSTLGVVIRGWEEGKIETCRGAWWGLSAVEWTELDLKYRPQFPLRHHGIYATIERHGQQHYRWLCGSEPQQGCSPGRPCPLE